MAKMISLICPQCGAKISIDEGRKKCFCTYCGTELLLNDNSNTITYRTIDEARIKESEDRKQIVFKEFESRNIQDKTRLVLLLSLLFVWVSSMIVFVVISLKTLDNVNFSPYQLLLILDIALGFRVILRYLKK